ncbi:MAG: class II fructose-bisphosphate aldolase [Lachnospiraceae bacterium]|nr:class II fructose-bisphosphate aldolase [Lachnospiraceae bacterium]
MLVNASEVLNAAKRDGYAVCAPNIINVETGRCIVEAAEKIGAPVILDIHFHGPYGSFAKKRWLNDYVHQLSILADRSRTPVVIQQDHGPCFESWVCCIAAGCTSIMADCSELPYEENVEKVADLVRIAHACGVSVEAELGHVGLGNNYAVDGVTNLTDTDLTAEYVKRTGCDSLAVAIGTAHGMYKGTPHIDFDRLEEVKKMVDVPLVLHGGSSTGDENLYRLAHSGINKINIATDLPNAGIANLQEAEKSGKLAPFFNAKVNAFNEGFTEKCRHYMELFGSANRY